MTSTATTLRLDPWAAEYEASIQVTEDAEPARVDTGVECATWAAVRPGPQPGAERLAFVDGVRRIEHRLLIETGGRTVFGLVGSYAVGAVMVGSAARVESERIGRVLVASGGAALEPFRVAVGRGPALVFEARSEPENTPVAPVDGLQKAMREQEARLTERLSTEVDVAFQDGPLSFLFPPAAASVVGFVKRLQRAYLEPAFHALLPQLATGERTPLFLIEGRELRYSWYQRIAIGRPIEAALTGVVRLETPASRGLDEARRLADLAARELPRFASDPRHDPRAPQNLFPVGGLESRLKHLLGDPAVVRRAIESQLHREVSA
ncbi:MAG TPA: hypothetical protein VEQ10_15415 [Vicinamibacteria bacterium]|nr:hypothetical protein [Vicinamibacteria bacterium]